MEEKVLDFIKTCLRRRRMLWTYHANMRLQERFISREAILSSVDTYEIIESYPSDKYLPSFLLLSVHGGKAIHVHVAADFDNEMVRIITAYKPTLDKWEEGFKKRRKP
jgi:hypothetical protein